MESIVLYVLYSFFAVIGINILYYLFFLKFAFAKAKKSSKSHNPEPISLVVCSKNEAENLRKNIPIWLAQNHPKFQLILINDASLDKTKEVIESFAQKDSRITVVNVENNEAFWGSKKYALTLGIKTAKYEHLIFTDADCTPASNEWLSQMASNFSDTKQLVLGYGAYKKVKNSFLNKLIRFETLNTALQYFSYAILGRPYMGVGRNMGYTTALFYEQRGFMGHMDIASGDDDLFVNEAATNKNTALCFHKKAFTISAPKKSFKDWRIQKRRHISTANHYSTIDAALLSIFYVSQLLFILLGMFLLIVKWEWMFVLIAIGVRYVISWFVIGKVALKLKEKDLILFYPFYEVFLIFFQLSIFSSNIISKPTRWK